MGAFATDGLGAIAGLMTLSLVPDLLNILPMYIVLLALVPFAMALSRISPLLVLAVSAALWLVVQTTGLNLPAGGAPGRTWLFDPFAWQLMFFTGFAFGMGWLPKARLNHPALLPIAAVVVALSVPINFWAFTDNIPALLSVRDWLISDGIIATTRLAVLRYAHFLCLAYIVLSLVDRFPRTIALPALAPVAAIGRQSLSTFVSSVALAWIAGRLLDVVGRGFMSVVSGLSIPKNVVDAGNPAVLIDYLTQPAIQDRTLSETGFFPVVASGAKDDVPRYLQELSAAVRRQAASRDAIPTLVPIGLGERGDDYNNLFMLTFSQIVLEGRDASAVLNSNAALLQKLIDEENAKCWLPDVSEERPCKIE